MIAKTFEIRDVATFIPVLAVKLSPVCESDRYLLARSGFGRTPEEQARYIYVTRLAGGLTQGTSQPYEQMSNTMRTAHGFIEKEFDNLESGAVIDVEFILGRVERPKTSESTVSL
jgi:hypothetical protein